ncbi:MAG TPA: Rne/Rng family ribonuclease [Phycisphaerae bacterium]|nr:Rne/Rng family ribonuclease [Phycisphaerae bacterium]
MVPNGSGDRVMLINVSEGEECRIAIMHQERIEELFIERISDKSHVGNIYKGRVTNVEPSIQAAFVDFGFPKNGFLHISDLLPQYFPQGMQQSEEVGRKTPRRDRPPIQKCLRRGQEVIVQIIKEGIGTKGPTLTSYISIPGRYLVMMPGMNRLGVSRKIEDDEVRRRMRRLLEDLSLPRDIGFIMRTAGVDRTKRDLQRDLNYLQRLWKVVAERIKNDRAPCELYQESDLVIRTIRDVYSSDFNKIVVDSEVVADKVRDFLAIAMPRASMPVEVYSGPIPLFHKYEIETEIDLLNRRQVPLRSGGSLVIDSTEAMVAIDVNSGRFRDHEDAEETAFRTNMEAAEEIARQLRLRDLGGLIVCDFIDMRHDKNIRAVEREVRDALRKHKERARCLRISQFGIMEITRQRMRPSIKRSVYQDCPGCHGTGMVKNAESMTLDVARLLRIALHHEQVRKVSVRVPPSVAFHLQNHRREVLHRLEKESGVQIIIHGDRHMGLDQYVFECFDRRGGVIKVMQSAESARPGALPHGRQPQAPAQQEHVWQLDTLDEVMD